MKKTSLTLLLAFSALMALAQKPININLWPNGAPNSNFITEPDDTINPRSYSRITKAVLTVYPASRPNGKAIVACPGGGYSHLSMTNEGHDLAAWFNSQGITYAVLRYRMPNTHSEVPLSDVRKALETMRENAEKWHLDPQKVGIMGFSAGGHLASTAATHLDKNEAPSFQILLYPVISMDSTLTHKGSVNCLLGKKPSKDDVKRFSNDLRVNAGTPRCFIALSSDDKAVPPLTNGLRYYEALVRNGVSATLHCYPSGGHGWGFRDTFGYKRQWTEELEKWLRSF